MDAGLNRWASRAVRNMDVRPDAMSRWAEPGVRVQRRHPAHVGPTNRTDVREAPLPQPDFWPADPGLVVAAAVGAGAPGCWFQKKNVGSSLVRIEWM